MLIRGTEVSFTHRDVRYANDAEIEKLTELVMEEQRYHQNGEVVELVVETDFLGRNVRYRTVVNVEHNRVVVESQTAEFDEDEDRLRKIVG